MEGEPESVPNPQSNVQIRALELDQLRINVVAPGENPNAEIPPDLQANPAPFQVIFVPQPVQRSGCCQCFPVNAAGIFSLVCTFVMVAIGIVISIASLDNVGILVGLTFVSGGLCCCVCTICVAADSLRTVLPHGWRGSDSIAKQMQQIQQQQLQQQQQQHQQQQQMQQQLQQLFQSQQQQIQQQQPPQQLMQQPQLLQQMRQPQLLQQMQQMQQVQQSQQLQGMPYAPPSASFWVLVSWIIIMVAGIVMVSTATPTCGLYESSVPGSHPDNCQCCGDLIYSCHSCSRRAVTKNVVLLYGIGFMVGSTLVLGLPLLLVALKVLDYNFQTMPQEL